MKEYLESNGINVNAALEFWGDLDSYSDSLKEYYESLDEKVNNLEYYKNTKDFENYGILAHSIKSESKYLGFMNEANVFLEHEMAGKESNEEVINNKFNELKDTVNKIKDIISNCFSKDNKKTILIADDSNIMLNFIEKTIGNNYKIIRANNGKDAINIIQNSEIYAILLDLNMPNVNGFQVLDYLNDNELIEKIPVVIITGDDTEDTIKKAFTYPILDVLNKPFTDSNINRVLLSIDNFYQNK